jgi:hypothetical protein
VSSSKQDPQGREVFRSFGAAIVWWVWVVFATANVVDLIVQGRDHLSLVAVFVLLFVTGIVYVTALRPRIVSAPDGLTIANPGRNHKVGWAAVAGVDATDLLRVRCEWPAGDETGHRAIYCWAVHSSRRRRLAADMRASARRSRSGSGGAGGFGFGGLSTGLGGTAGAAPVPQADALRLDTAKIAAEITDCAEQARRDAPETQPVAPVSTWDLTAVAAVVIPGLALLIAALT